jgi:hypothetical protein
LSIQYAARFPAPGLAGATNIFLQAANAVSLRAEEILFLGVFQQPEWDNFARVARTRPWLWPRYGWQLAGLVLRRIAQTLRMKIAGSHHRGLKLRPEWLGSGRAGVAGHNRLSFPHYPAATLTATPVSQPSFAANDAEGYFFSQRWSNCFAAALEGEAAATAALTDVLRWLRNPPAKNDAAWETYSSCERVVNLAVMLSVQVDCRRSVENEHGAAIAGFFAESAHWIDSRLEYYGMARTNNHILNNARALVVAGGVVGDSAAVERGLLLFARMAQVLFQAEGFLRERSSHYQYVVTNWLLDTLHFARASAVESKAALAALTKLDALSQRVSTATALLVTACEGLNTQIGDISPDNHPDAAIARLRCLYPAVFAAADTNIEWRRDDWLYVASKKHRLLTCGLPRDYPYDYTTHGHPDLGGFIWAYDDHPILVDAGRADYRDNPTSRLQTAAGGHNVLTVEGLPPLADSLLANGRWCPRPYAQATVNFACKSAAGFAIKHNGFQRIPGLGMHSRSVQIEDGGIAVLDTLEGTGTVEIEMFWHFAPGMLPLENSAGIAVGRGMRIAVTADGNDSGAARMHWREYPYSAAYGEVQQAFMLHVRRMVKLPWTGGTTLQAALCAA